MSNHITVQSEPDFNYAIGINKLVPSPKDFNPAALLLTEAEARAQNLWTDDRAMPTLEELKVVADAAISDQKKSEDYQKTIYDRLKKDFGVESKADLHDQILILEAMEKRPENYVGDGLIFATIEEVIEHSKIELAKADAFALFYLEENKKFNA